MKWESSEVYSLHILYFTQWEKTKSIKSDFGNSFYSHLNVTSNFDFNSKQAFIQIL